MTDHTQRRLLRRPGSKTQSRGFHACRFAIVLIGLTTIGSAALASQPISTSLAECSVIFTELAEVAERRNKPKDDISAVIRSATVFERAAFDQAKREGRPDPYDHVLSDLNRLTKKWHGRFGKITLVQENKDWIDYCRSLGKNRGLELP